MSELYILQNQDKLFLGKQKDWLDGRDRNSLFKTPHKDEAINQKVEISAKDYRQRISLLQCPLDERGLPVIQAEDQPPAQPKPAKKSASFSSVEGSLFADGSLSADGSEAAQSSEAQEADLPEDSQR